MNNSWTCQGPNCYKLANIKFVILTLQSESGVIALCSCFMGFPSYVMIILHFIALKYTEDIEIGTELSSLFDVEVFRSSEQLEELGKAS